MYYYVLSNEKEGPTLTGTNVFDMAEKKYKESDKNFILSSEKFIDPDSEKMEAVAKAFMMLAMFAGLSGKRQAHLKGINDQNEPMLDAIMLKPTASFEEKTQVGTLNYN